MDFTSSLFPTSNTTKLTGRDTTEQLSRYSNIHFVMTGLGPANEGNDTVGQVKTLDALLRDNGHSNSVINYLKVACYVNLRE